MEKEIYKLLEENLREQGLEDFFKEIVNEIKRLWQPFNFLGL